MITVTTPNSKLLNVIFNTQFGSHIYGTNTENSDVDYKGLYLADLEDIILKRDKESVVVQRNKKSGERNTRNDVDYEYKELRRFIKDSLDGQTYALDMLYTPREFYKQTSPIWEEIIQNRDRFLSKSMNAFIGYIRQQTGKYAMKGTRLDAVVSTIDYLKIQDPEALLGSFWYGIPKSEFVTLENYESIVNGKPRADLMLSVLEKKFQANVKVKFVLEILEKFYSNFGGRSKAAQENQGVDWKAVSHAYRACYQLLDIANEGKIVFPLKEAKYVLDVKNGVVSYKDKVQYELPILMQNAIDAINKSSLPDKPDPKFWEDFILKTYLTK